MENNMYWQGYKEIGNFTHCWWGYNNTTVGNNMAVSKNIKCGTTTWPSNSNPRYISKRTENWNSNICMHMFIAAGFRIAKGENKKCPPMDKWINKLWYIHNEILFSHKKESSTDNVTT